MRLYFKYVEILFKSQMQYRTSFLLLSFGQFIMPFTVFAGLTFLFERFGELKGWSFYEAALCFGVTHMAFAISECFIRGFDSFSSLVVSGEFDRLLVRPRGTVLQVLGSKFEFTRVGRLAQGLTVLLIALSGLDVEWNAAKSITLLLMIASGTLIFSGIFILAAAMCFWTIETMELANIFTDGGREMTQYPLNIYHKNVTRFFTFVIPFACVNYLPLLFILGKASHYGQLYMLLPLAGCLFIIPCLLIWRIGVRHYRSTGS